MEKMMGKDTVEKHSGYRDFIKMIEKIRGIINLYIEAEEYKMSIDEIWTGLFKGKVDKDKDVKAQKKRLENGEKGLNKNDLNNIISFAEKEWFEKFLREIYEKKMSEMYDTYNIISERLLEVIEENYGKRVRDMCSEFSLEKRIAILCVGAIRDYCWTNPSADIKKMSELLVSRNEEEKALEEKLAESKKGNGIVIVHGLGQSGKTTLVKKLLMGRKTVLFENKSYDEINREMCLVNEIAFERFLSDKEIIKDDLKDKLKKIPKEKYPVIVIDNFDKSLDELKKLDEFSKELQIAVVVITRKVYEIGTQLEVGRMETEELVELFKIVYEKTYIKQLEKDDSNDIPEISPEKIDALRKAVCNNAMFMAFIAEAYAVEKFNNVSGDEIVGKVLNQKEMIDKKDMKSEEKPQDYTSYVYQLYKSINGKDSTSDRQLRNTGEYLKRVFQDRIEGQDIPFYILLSCLDGTAVPENCLVQWFGLKKDKIEYFVNEGWCMKDGDMITPFVPRYLIFQMNKLQNAQKEKKVIAKFLERFLKEIRNESTIAVNMQIIKAVMLKLYSFLTNRLIKDKEYLDLVAGLRISCIRFCIQMYDAKAAKELLDEMSGSAIEKDEVVEQCFKASIPLINGEELENIKQLEDDYLKKIEENISEYSEEKCMAFLEFFNIFMDGCLLRWIDREFGEEESKIFDFKIGILENYIRLYKIVLGRIYYKNTENEVWLQHYGIIAKIVKNLCRFILKAGFHADVTIEIRNMGCCLWELCNQNTELLEIQNKDENVSRLVRIQTGCLLLDALCLNCICQKYLGEYAKTFCNNQISHNELCFITNQIGQIDLLCKDYIEQNHDYFMDKVYLRMALVYSDKQ